MLISVGEPKKIMSISGHQFFKNGHFSVFTDPTGPDALPFEKMSRYREGFKPFRTFHPEIDAWSGTATDRLTGR